MNNLSETSFQNNSPKETEEMSTKLQRYSDGYLIYPCLTCILNCRINEQLEQCSKIYAKDIQAFKYVDVCA